MAHLVQFQSTILKVEGNVWITHSSEYDPTFPAK